MPPDPIALTDDQVREVETLAALLNQDQIADYFGISRTTFRRIRERDEEVRIRYKRGKARAIAHVANGLLQKARAGDTTSMIFFLKTQAGWRETERREHSGPDGGPMETVSARGRLSELLEQAVRAGDGTPEAGTPAPAARPEGETDDAR